MQHFIDQIKAHAEHVNQAGQHCATEETTKQALILPLLNILGFSAFDPTKVKAEYAADFPGVKANERVDYALFCQGVPVMFIEAKAWNEKLSNHAPQLSRYFNATPEVAVAAITNGREWRFFTDLVNKNVMDTEPFLSIDFSAPDESLIPQLLRFHHDQFRPDALRTLAEESVLLNAFKLVIQSSVLGCDADFVRFVAGKANIQRSLTAKFLEQITPIVQQATAQSMSERIADSLSGKTQPPITAIPEGSQPTSNNIVASNAQDDVIDPINPKIITTAAEREVLAHTIDILGSDSEITGKDTESYYTILFQGKTNRWLLRYHGERRTPAIQFIVPLDDDRRREIARAGLEINSGDYITLTSPSHILRLAGILRDALDFCKNDDNFRKVKAES